jgi:hypothetical protein
LRVGDFRIFFEFNGIIHIISLEEVKNAMSALANYQTILGNVGKPAFVVIPFADFIKLPGAVTPGTIPYAVVGRRIMDGVSMLQAWREYLMLTQTAGQPSRTRYVPQPDGSGIVSR